MPAGSVVTLRAGSYQGGFGIYKPVTLQAYPGEKVVISAPTNDPNIYHVIYVLAPQVSLKRLELVGGSWFGVKFDYPYGSVENCVIHGTGHRCRLAPL